MGTGAIIAAVLFTNEWCLEDCIKFFEVFARVAFQPRCWWLRIPLLSKVIQIVGALLIDSRYSSQKLEEILQRVLGTRSIMSCSCATAMGSKLGIPVTTIGDASACIFTSYNGVGGRQDDSGDNKSNPFVEKGTNHCRLSCPEAPKWPKPNTPMGNV